MKQYKVMAHIHSLDGEMREVTVLKQEDMFGHPIPNAYIVDYGGVKCTAIFNTYNGQYYADDKYGIIKEN
ncbi:MAG: hypothetical protein J6C62_02260 [Clostridia bacterium]|nr:hypothetical protein [Clostridia bacterium]